jgi:hypothetical protein
MSAPGVDIYDDWWWKSSEGRMARRQNYFAAMRHLGELSRQLSQQADEEYQRRQAAESPEDRKQREEWEWMLKDLVLRANAETDPGEAEKSWAAVDAMVFGPGAA